MFEVKKETRWALLQSTKTTTTKVVVVVGVVVVKANLACFYSNDNENDTSKVEISQVYLMSGGGGLMGDDIWGLKKSKADKKGPLCSSKIKSFPLVVKYASVAPNDNQGVVSYSMLRLDPCCTIMHHHS